jgi:photosystem II stability/assembly factor-like uncharacterized protein
MKLDPGSLRPLSRRQALRCALAGTAGLAVVAATGRAGAAAQGGLSALREGVLIAGRAVGNSLWVSDNRGQLFASDDGGASWRVQGSRARGAITSLAFGSGLAIAVGHRSALLRSGDGGTQWAAATLPAQESVSLLDAVVLSPTHALAVGAFGAYWRSHDAGLSWVAAQPIAGDRHHNAIAGNAQGQLVIVGEGGLILRSADGGQSWAEVASPVKASLFAVVATRGGHFIAAGLGGTVLCSVDGGTRWTVTNTPAHNSWLGASLLDDDSVLLAGNGGALCRLVPGSVPGQLSVARQAREGYGAWSALLPCTPQGGVASLLAVGETGLLRLDRAPWLTSGAAA